MKVRFLALSLALGASLQAREVIPGVVSFDEPAGFIGSGGFHDSGDNPFELSQTITQYLSKGNSSDSFQQFDIGLGVFGYEIGNGKAVTYKKLSPDELKKEVMNVWSHASRAPNSLVIKDGVVSGRKAYIATEQVPAPRFRRGAIFWKEAYFIPIDENRGVTLSLTADSEERLDGLRELVKRVKIPADAHFVVHPTSGEKKQQQVVYNLAIITAAGGQALQMRGGAKITLPEIRKAFAAELAKAAPAEAETLKAIVAALAKVTPVDGEDYEQLVYEKGKPLRVSTKSFGEVEYPPKPR